MDPKKDDKTTPLGGITPTNAVASAGFGVAAAPPVSPAVTAPTSELPPTPAGPTVKTAPATVPTDGEQGKATPPPPAAPVGVEKSEEEGTDGGAAAAPAAA